MKSKINPIIIILSCLVIVFVVLSCVGILQKGKTNDTPNNNQDQNQSTQIPDGEEDISQAALDLFTIDAQGIVTAAQKQWIMDSRDTASERIYSKCSNGCDNTLDYSTNSDYYIEFARDGNILKYYITNGEYQFKYVGDNLTIEEVNPVAINEVSDEDVIVITPNMN